MRNLDLTKDAIKFLEKLPPKQFRQIAVKEFSLLSDPQPNDSKKLVGYPFFRIDSGEYRVVYRFDEKTVYVAIIDKRNDSIVYKRLKRSKG